MLRWLFLGIFILLPHISFPGSIRYIIRPSDFLILVLVFFSTCSLLKFKLNSQLASSTLLVFSLSCASIVWGCSYLAFEQINQIYVNGEIVFYLPLAIQKILLLIICLSGFHLVIGVKQIDNKILLQYWFYGTLSAFLIQIITYAIDLPLLVRRAGVFDEGNFGGSYYLLSFFLMWIAVRYNYSFGKIGMATSFVGVLLTQSSIALVIITALILVHTLFVIMNLNKRKGNALTSIFLLLIVSVVVTLIFGNELVDKLTGEELTANSFSRYDRLSSILSGISMFTSSPLFGVGLQGYAFALPHHSNEFLDSFFDYSSQRIANNIYVQLLAEQGIIGALAMAYLMYRIMRPSFISLVSRDLVLMGFASVLLSWLAFPSYTNTFHWLGFALLYRISRENLSSAKITTISTNA